MKREFPAPKISLEQYPTSPELTTSVILEALLRGDLGPGRSALDLGCGTGMLAVACALVESDYVLAVDCDEDALQVALENRENLELGERISFVLGRVTNLKGNSSKQSKVSENGCRGRGRGRGRDRTVGSGRQGRGSTKESMELITSDNDGLPLRSRCVDTVLTNPPFGTKNNAGMDLRFLRAATRLARTSVYSFHKTSTRDFVSRVVNHWGMNVEVVAQMKFDLPQTYKFHKEKSVDVEVDLIRVAVFPDEERAEEE